MRKNSEYIKLTKYLKKSNSKDICLTFKEIESILGFGLPEYAKRKTWWYNNKRNRHCFWLDAGFLTSNVSYSIKKYEIIFKKPKRISKFKTDPVLLTIISIIVTLISISAVFWNPIQATIDINNQYTRTKELIQTYEKSEDYDSIVKICDENLNNDLLEVNPNAYIELLYNKTSAMETHILNVSYFNEKEYLDSIISLCCLGKELSKKYSNSLELDFIYKEGMAYNILSDINDVDGNITNAINDWQLLNTRLTYYEVNNMITEQKTNEMIVSSNCGLAMSYVRLSKYKDTTENVENALKYITVASKIMERHVNGEITISDEVRSTYIAATSLTSYKLIQRGERDPELIDAAIYSYQTLIESFQDGSIGFSGFLYDDLADLYLYKYEIDNNNVWISKSNDCLIKGIHIRPNEGYADIALIESNLAIVSCKLDTSLANDMIDLIDGYLNEINISQYPYDYAHLQDLKGYYYLELFYINYDSANLDKADEAFAIALAFYTKEDYSIQYENETNMRNLISRLKSINFES